MKGKSIVFNFSRFSIEDYKILIETVKKSIERKVTTKFLNAKQNFGILEIESYFT